MLQKMLINFVLIILFALVQIGVATHEISHFADSSQQQQQDQHNSESQCEQCLSYSHAAVADVSHHFSFNVVPVGHIFTASELTSTHSANHSLYSARAPPTTSET